MSRLAQRVLRTIEERRLAPRPRAYFLALRSAFWSLTVASVVLGGVSAAVGISAAVNSIETGGRGFDEIPFDDVVSTIPIVWLAIFLVFTASAVIGFRHTRYGYRYRSIEVLTLSALAAVILGLILNAADVGRVAHRYIAAHLPAYERYTHIPHDEWDDPAR
jgi:hypothetical protein